MNFFKKYKSNLIAVFVSLAFYGLLILLLCVMPSTDSSLKTKDDIKNQEEPIQFQIMEVIPLPPTPDDKKNEEKKPTEELSKESQPKEIINNTDEIKNNEQSSDETNVIENQDSVILAELQKSLEVFKEIIPIDSLEKNSIQKKNTQKINQALAGKNQYSEEDWQFIRNNYRTILSIKRVYPYVLKTKGIVDNLNSQLASITNKQEKRNLIKKTEKELFQEFEKDVHSMSYSQGKLLLKLLARETNQSAFGLIKTYKGGIPATFWYGVGLLFRENLKVRYDSLGEDAILEQIIKKYKLGKL